MRGESHPDTLAIAANLSLDRQACGDISDAEELREDTMRRYRADAFLEHPIARRRDATAAASMSISSPTELSPGDPKVLDPGCCLSSRSRSRQ